MGKETRTKKQSVADRLEEIRVELKSMKFLLRSRRRKVNEIIAELTAVQNIYLKREE